MALLDDVLNAVTSANTTLGETTGALLGNTAKQTSIEDIISGIQSQAAADNSVITQQKGISELQTQKTRSQIANVFGTDMSVQANVLTGLSQTATNAYNERADALAEIKRKQSVTIFDNPLEYIMNRFTINSDIAKHNAADETYTNAETRIQQLNADTDATIKTNNQLSQSLTEASIESATRNAAASALIEAQKAKLAGVTSNTQGIEAVSKMTKDQLSNLFSYANVYQQQASLANSSESLALHIQEAAQRTEAFKQNQEDKADTKEFYDNQLSIINAGRKATGKEELTGSAGKQVIALMKNSPNSPITQEYATDYAIGERSKTAGYTKYANNIGEAVNTLSKTEVKLSPAQDTVKEFLGSVKGNFDKLHSTPGTEQAKIDPKDTTGKTVAMAVMGREAILQMSTNIKPTDNSNLLNIGSLNLIASNSAVIPTLPVYQKVFAQDIANGVQFTDAGLMFQKTVDAVANKTISYNEALELTTIFQQGVALNAVTRNFRAFGIDPPASYNSSAPIRDAGKAFGNAIVDYTKPDQLGRAINLGLVQKAIQEHSYQGTLMDSVNLPKIKQTGTGK